MSCAPAQMERLALSVYGLEVNCRNANGLSIAHSTSIEISTGGLAGRQLPPRPLRPSTEMKCSFDW